VAHQRFLQKTDSGTPAGSAIVMPLEEPTIPPIRAQSEACERAESPLTPREVIAVADEDPPMLERRRDTRYPTNDPAEVRYCRAVADGFHVGVWIEHMFNAREELGKHIDDMDLCMYVMGKGLTVEEVILLKDHLMTCETCQVRAAKKEAALQPVSGPKIKTYASGTD
jgi:hypothetical protein